MRPWPAVWMLILDNRRKRNRGYLIGNAGRNRTARRIHLPARPGAPGFFNESTTSPSHRRCGPLPKVVALPHCKEPTMGKLTGKRVAILASHGFEESELQEPLRVLRENGADVDVVSPETGTIQGMRHLAQGKSVPMDQTAVDADASDNAARRIP